MPVLLVFPHVNSLSRLSSFDKGLFGLTVALLILKEEGKLQMDVRDLVEEVVFVSHLEGFVELLPLGKVFDCRIEILVLQQLLKALFWSETFRPLLR